MKERVINYRNMTNAELVRCAEARKAKLGRMRIPLDPMWEEIIHRLAHPEEAGRNPNSRAPIIPAVNP